MNKVVLVKHRRRDGSQLLCAAEQEFVPASSVLRWPTEGAIREL